MSALLGAISSRIYQSVRTLPGTLWSRVMPSTLAGNNTPSTNTWATNSLSSIQHQSKRFYQEFPQFANLPPVSRVAGKGNSYQTTVHRKRVIKDPNLPNFEHQEALKWTTWRMLRDVRRRHMFTRYNFDQVCYTNLQTVRMLPSSIRVSILNTHTPNIHWPSLWFLRKLHLKRKSVSHVNLRSDGCTFVVLSVVDHEVFSRSIVSVVLFGVTLPTTTNYRAWSRHPGSSRVVASSNLPYIA